MDDVELETQILNQCAVKCQANIRRFISRCRMHKRIQAQYEKIYDPIRKKYYYYDTINDKSSWKKPLGLLYSDLSIIAPTYSTDQAVVILQRFLMRRVAIRRVRTLYKSAIQIFFDESTERNYYFNAKTGQTFWDLPKFMGGKLDHNYEALKKLSKLPTDTDAGDSDEGSDEDDGDDDSNVSLDPEALRAQRRAARKFPRSKGQYIIDYAEDDIEKAVELDMSGLQARRITSRLYDLHALVKLNLSRNRLQHINSEIQYLSNLQVLNIEHNNMRKLPKELEELTKLREFHAAHNNLSTFSGYFYKLQRLELLDLSHNEFTAIPVETGNLELLKDLREWEVGVGVLKKLQVLRVSYCHLTDWPTQLDLLPVLTELRLAGNSLTAVPVTIKANKELSILDVARNQVASLPSELYELPLEVLLIQYNQLETLPPFPQQIVPLKRKNMDHLTELDISYNKITFLGPEIGIMVNMQKLNASHNNIANIDECMGVMWCLTRLDLSYNKLSHLPSSIIKCAVVTWMDLSHNMLTELPATLSTMVYLTHLNACVNKIERIAEEAFEGQRLLTMVDLHENCLTYLPSSFFTLNKLEVFYGAHNRLLALHDYMRQMSSMHSLFLSYNSLSELPSPITKLTQLKIMELDHNKLHILPTGLSAMTSIRRLVLTHNELTESPHEIFLLPKLIGWDLSWNLGIKSKCEDLQQIEDDYLRAKTKDLIPLSTLKRNIEKGWQYLDRVADSRAKAEVHSMADLMANHKRLSSYFKAHASSLVSAIDEAAHFKTRGKLLYDQIIHLPKPKSQKGEDDNSSSWMTRAITAHLRRHASERLCRLLSQQSRDNNALQVNLLDDNDDVSPDADLLETLALDFDFQDALKIFEACAHEINFLSIDLRLRQLRQDEMFKTRPASIDSAQHSDKSSVDQPAPATHSMATFGSGFFSSSSPSKGNKGSVKPSDKNRKPPAESSKSVVTMPEDVVTAVAGTGAVGAEWPELVTPPKPRLIDWSSVPHISQPSSLGSSQDELFRLAFDCYLGLATALTRAAQAIAVNIRDLEKRAAVKVSCLDAAQRIGIDFSDIIPDKLLELEEHMEKKSVKRVGTSLQTKKNDKMKELMSAAGAGDDAIAGDDGMDGNEGDDFAPGSIASRQQSGAVEFGSRPPTTISSARPGSEMISSLSTATWEAEVQPAVELETAPPIAPQIAKRNITFLMEYRNQLVLWARVVLSSGSEMLRQRGIDPLCPRFRSIVTSMEDGAEFMMRDAVRFHYIRAQALQMSGNYNQAIEEHKSALLLSRSKFRPASIELIKTYIANSDFAEGKRTLLELIERDGITLSESPPALLDVYRQNEELAHLLMMCDAALEQVHGQGLFGWDQRRVFNVRESGLNHKATPVSHELLYGHKLTAKAAIAARVVRVTKKAAELAREEERELLIRKLHNLATKTSNKLEDIKTEILTLSIRK